MKTLKVITASAVLAASSAASADWFNNPGYAYAPYAYAPYAAPALTEEQIAQMQENAEIQRQAFATTPSPLWSISPPNRRRKKLSSAIRKP